jgi:predicted O-methyltransferase YrrM
MAKFEIEGISQEALPVLIQKIKAVFSGEDSEEIFQRYQEKEVISLWKDIPHLTQPTIEFLEKILTPESEVLETGSGGSTLWIAKRVKWITSFEHNETWFQLVMRKLLDEKLKNFSLNFMPDYPNLGVQCAGQYDLVFIDGRGRVRSIETTISHVKLGGYLLLDDSAL